MESTKKEASCGVDYRKICTERRAFNDIKRLSHDETDFIRLKFKGRSHNETE